MTGAFTPTCSINHVPGYIQNLPQLKEKGVQVVAVIASNDSYVMSAWGKANNVKGDDIVSVSNVDSCELVAGAKKGSSSSPIPTRASQTPSAGPMAVAPGALPLSLIMARSRMPRLRRRGALLR